MAWAVLIFTAVVPGYLADVFQAKGQESVSPSESQVLLAGEPLFAAVMGAFCSASPWARMGTWAARGSWWARSSRGWTTEAPRRAGTPRGTSRRRARRGVRDRRGVETNEHSSPSATHVV